MIKFNNVTKIFPIKKASPVVALDGITFELPDRGLIFILGKSGCGKSTLLNLLGGLDGSTDGEILFENKSLTKFDEKEFVLYRRSKVGFVFQDFNLLGDLTVGQNLVFVTDLLGWEKKSERVVEALAWVDLSGYEKRKTTELSGGQKQRVSIARALIKQPSLILADEPTGNLDSENAKRIFELLKTISSSRLVMVVSHDEESAQKYADRIIRLADGRIVMDSSINEMSNEGEPYSPKVSDSVGGAV